ncbi:hypothetical protein [Scytonema millei]|nr:hypothetical protein [Scytonema millei]
MSYRHKNPQQRSKLPEWELTGGAKSLIKAEDYCRWRRLLKPCRSY